MRLFRRWIAIVVAVLVLGLGSSAQAAIAIDGTPIVGVSGAFDNDVTAPNVVVGSGTDRYLTVMLAWQVDGSEPDFCNFGATAMTKISPATSPDFAGKRIAAYGLDDPPTSTANVVCDSGQDEWFASVVAISWTGVSGATGWATATTGTSGAPTVNILTVGAGEVTIDVLASGAGNIAVGAGPGTRNTLADTTIGGSAGFGSSRNSGSTGTVAMGWTTDVDDWLMSGFRLTVAGGGGAAPAPKLMLLGVSQ